jgi:hypothetical protein
MHLAAGQSTSRKISSFAANAAAVLALDLLLMQAAVA